MKKLKNAGFLLKKAKNNLFLQRENERGSLAQLVQSIALTRRGSLVRVQQFPLEKQGSHANMASFCF